MSDGKLPAEMTEFGFKWGPMELTRFFEHNGSVCFEVKSKTREIQIHVFKGGKVRIFTVRRGKKQRRDAEWTEPK